MVARHVDFSNLDLRASKKQIVDIFKVFSGIKTGNLRNIIFDVQRVSNIKDYDLSFLINFLYLAGYIDVQNDKASVIIDIHPEDVYINFCKYYIDRFLDDQILKREVLERMVYNVVDDKIIISVESIELNYRNYLYTFEQLGMLKWSTGNRYKVVSNIYLAMSLLERPLRKISLKEFERIQELKKIKGQRAENFVLELEKNKLKELGLIPKIVSEEDVNLGYDIESFDLLGKKIFIEVKSLVSDSYFFWSSNEIFKSRAKGDSYFIYCISFQKSNNPSLAHVIKNPHEQVFDRLIYKTEESKDVKVFLPEFAGKISSVN